MQFLLPLADLPLSILMVYCAFILIVFHRRFFQNFGMTRTSRKLVYWSVTLYIAASIPGHVMLLRNSLKVSEYFFITSDPNVKSHEEPDKIIIADLLMVHYLEREKHRPRLNNHKHIN